MYKAALALLVGLMLSVSGSAWGANIPGQPANSWVHNDQWYCNDGFKKEGNQCVGIGAPANSWVHNDQWYCNDGFKKEGNQCVGIGAPANSWVHNDQWYCNDGFKKEGNQCVGIGAPANSWVHNDQWYCNDGFKKEGNQCVGIGAPANSWVHNDQWYCNDGFKKEGNQCVGIGAPANSWVHNDQWYCNDGFKKEGNQCVSIFAAVKEGEPKKISSEAKAADTTTPKSENLLAAQRKAEELEQRLADLEAQLQEKRQIIANDNQVPFITITQSGTDQRKGVIRGFARDNLQIAEVLVDGSPVNVAADGSFEWTGFVPVTGKDIIIEAIDTAALSSTKVIRLERGQIQQASGPRFDDLDPTAGKRVEGNDNALALIVGISDYKRTEAPAIYADKDAQFFHDYASLKLGIPDQNITTLVNEKAEQGDVLLAVKDWLRRSSKPGKSDVYVFFAGHGLASQDGEQMYLLPFDGRPRLLDKTAILREELFDDIASANPRSVTVFLDTCYSGTTRGTDMLIASRPIAIKALKQSVPDNFTVMTAARGDQTAKPLEEAKHGMFSYFLMKGMEGEADTNQDNKITAGELHSYVQKNVIQQSSGSQTPELQGDANRVLVQFQ
jgi:hypothetical protein